MSHRINTPDGPVDFPDSMTDQQIEEVLKKQYPPSTISSAPTGIKGLKAGIATAAGKVGDVLFRKENLPAAFATAYGLAGAPSGPGAIGMAALGGATGRAVEQMIDTGEGKRQPSSGAAAWDIGVEGAKQGVIQGLGEGIALAASKILPISRGARLSYAGGLTQGADVVNQLAPEFDKTLAATGRRSADTVGEFADVVQGTNTRLEQEYNQALFPVTQQSVRPLPVANAIKQKITPNMGKTAEGRKQIQYLLKKAREFETQDWTIGELDLERRKVAKKLNEYFSGGPSNRAKKAVLDEEIMADTAQRDALNDLLYPLADRTAGKPSGYFKALKQKQSTLTDITSDIAAHRERLVAGSAQKKGAPLLEKTHVYAYGHPTSSSLGSIGSTFTPSRFLDPLAQANRMTRSGFPSTAQKAVNIGRTVVAKPFTNATVDALPIRALWRDEPEPDTTPPPKKSPGQQKKDLAAIQSRSSNPNLPVGP